jgi:hypothetical protein
VPVAVMHAASHSAGIVQDKDPINSLVRTFPSGCFLLRDTLAASAHFLLPWLTTASLQQGNQVSMTWLCLLSVFLSNNPCCAYVG